MFPIRHTFCMSRGASERDSPGEQARAVRNRVFIFESRAVFFVLCARRRKQQLQCGRIGMICVCQGVTGAESVLCPVKGGLIKKMFDLRVNVECKCGINKEVFLIFVFSRRFERFCVYLRVVALFRSFFCKELSFYLVTYIFLQLWKK